MHNIGVMDESEGTQAAVDDLEHVVFTKGYVVFENLVQVGIHKVHDDRELVKVRHVRHLVLTVA